MAKLMREVVSVRLDPQVIADLRCIATARGTTVSELLREGAIVAANEPNAMTIEWITPPAVVTDRGRSATFAPTQQFDIPAVHLVPGQTIRYGGLEWTVAEILTVYPLENVAVIAVGSDGKRAVLFYADSDSKAQVIGA